MFSSSTSSIINNANPLRHPSIFGHDNGEDIFDHRHHQDLTTNAHFLVAPAPAAINNNAPPVPLEYTNNILVKDRNHLINCDPFMINLVPRWKKPAAAAHSSKNRHRKIMTAQGPRDRRARLSIQIARKFFDLQDTLGFDKASKTLDWLLTKSKSAIEDLVKMKHSCCTSTGAAAEIMGDNLKIRKPLMSSSTSVTKEKRNNSMQQQQKNSTTFPLLARESRAKARERARERTREKMSIRKLNESKKLVPDSGPHIPIHSSSWNQSISSQNSRMVPYFNVGTEINQSIAESILMKRKLNLKPSQSFINLKQVSLNSPNVTENWDISNIFSQVIPSTMQDFQNCGKMWEVYSCKI